MGNFKKITSTIVMVLLGLILFSCSDDEIKDPANSMTPSEILSSTAWETTNAKNNKGENVSLTDANVANFVGFAYFKADGTFTMFNLDDSLKMKGDWSVTPDGKTRTIIAKNDAGEVLFTRVVDITVLTKQEFTYRIYPDNNDKSVYFDIIHTPTDHQEPKIMTPSEILSSTAWETTNAKNNKGENVSLTDANVANFVGFAYFKANGTFTMFNLDDSPKMKGDWSVTPDGKTRTIIAKNDAGEVLFTRVVDITVLTKQEFTYRIYPDNNDKSIYFDIIHTPTDHKEPK